MNNENENQDVERTTEESVRLAEKLPMPTLADLRGDLPFKCPKCPKSFLSAAGLHMHNMRVHTKQILARGQKGWKPNPKARAERAHYPSSNMAQRRKKYREARDRFYAMGLDAKGRPFRSELGKRISQIQRAGAERNRTWTPERTEKFKATMKRVAREKAMRRMHHQPEHPNSLTAKKRIQFVYPTPGQLADRLAERAADKPAIAVGIKFCPHCGNNIEKYL